MKHVYSSCIFFVLLHICLLMSPLLPSAVVQVVYLLDKIWDMVKKKHNLGGYVKVVIWGI